MFYYILNQRCRKCEHAEIDEEKEIFRCKMTNQDIRVIDRIQAECMTYVREHPEVIEEEKRKREARDLLHKRAQSALRACENVLNEIFTTATPADQIVKQFSYDLAAARNTLSLILGIAPIWHCGPVEAETNGEQDEVSIIAWRTSGGKRIIEWTPYCPMRDGKWEDFVYSFRILYWCYEKDLYEQAENEAKNENH